ncbi:CoA-binding protein [Chloroflexota bacterium]
MKPDFKKLERAFNPKCIAIIGDKKAGNYMWCRSHANFKGKLYSVQIDPGEIPGIEELGVKNYLSLMDIPEPVDLAIVAVPRQVTPRILDDCIRKDVAAAHFYTAGFSESDTDEGIALENLLIEKSAKANFHLVGPNCMGIFNPSIGVGQGAAFNEIPAGPVGLISQSGMHAGTFIRESHLMGLDVSKAVSYGNGTVLDSPDYLEFFGNDPSIKAIGMYVEGVRDGKRFLDVLKDVSARKPVVIWKGGRTEQGERASASHTKTLSVAGGVWESVVRQGGALSVSSMEELIDTIKALVYMPEVAGPGVGVTGGSGGQSVVIADVITEAGLEVPPLTEKSYDKMASFFDLIGGAFKNPVDTANTNRERMKPIMEVLVGDDNINTLMLLMNARSGPGGQSDEQINNIIEIKKNTTKPVMVVLSWSFSPEGVEKAGEITMKLREGGVPAFITPERGAFALRKVLDYYILKQSIKP